MCANKLSIVVFLTGIHTLVTRQVLRMFFNKTEICEHDFRLVNNQQVT